MKRKRLTELLPWLLPLRQWQRNCFFYAKMKWDKNRYAIKPTERRLSHLLFEDRSLMINEQSGMDIQYQYNKVHNLKLAAATINGLIIEPNETFSFWQCVRNAKKSGKYKDGLCLVNGELVSVTGGGLCQISNLLFWCFVHSPLTILERHTHFVKAFPNPPSDIPEGMDATISEGWKDLKVRNDTDQAIQIILEFDEDYIYGRLLQEDMPRFAYEIEGRDLHFKEVGNAVYETISIYQKKTEINSGKTEETCLFVNECRIGYPLPAETIIEREQQ